LAWLTKRPEKGPEISAFRTFGFESDSWFAEVEGEIAESLRPYPKGIEYFKWLAEHGWDEAEQIKREAGTKGDKVHQAISATLRGAIPVPEARYSIWHVYDSRGDLDTEASEDAAHSPLVRCFTLRRSPVLQGRLHIPVVRGHLGRCC
jgi:hypothetical protein